jgi:two-component system osmolarity sensor histidine kinase EnvZ
MPLLRRYLPHTLFARWLLLLVAPVVLLQVVVTLVFYERHWDTVTRRLALGVAGEIGMLIELRKHTSDPELNRRLTALAQNKMQLQTRFQPGARLPATPQRLRFYSILDTMLSRALEERLALPYRIDTRRADEKIEIAVQLDDGVLSVLTEEKRLFSSTTYIFVLWMVGTSLVLLAVAILFLRNQVRPIRRLAEAADAFGKGREVEDFRPAGATEVRRAATAFLAMRDRIRRQIAQRTEMLAGVSHDLRTPLTRMKLQLALLGSGPEVVDLKRDVGEMERMIEGYLAFARGQDGEPAMPTDLSEILSDVIKDLSRQGRPIALEAERGLLVPLRQQTFRRSIANILTNALRHGRNVAVSAKRVDGSIEIAIDDDGPGIPPEQRDAVFRPFVRLDPSRNPASGGVGLGLTIARDAIRGHGGDIELQDAPAGGLRALIKLPI